MNLEVVPVVDMRAAKHAHGVLAAGWPRGQDGQTCRKYYWE